MFELFKWLLWLAMPFTWVLIALVAMSVTLWWKRALRWAVLSTLFTGGILALSLPVVANAIGVSLESAVAPQPLKAIPTADAIVVLGGGIGRANEVTYVPECYRAADRAVMAARLFHAGKAPVILPSGEISAEAEKPLLETMRVPASRILCDVESRDTAENAQQVVRLLQQRKAKKMLLVTSAWHMRRALMMFEGSGLEVIPVGCDYEATLARSDAAKRPLWMKLPSAAALEDSCVYLKEYLGILFYSFKKNTFEKVTKE